MAAGGGEKKGALRPAVAFCLSLSRARDNFGAAPACAHTRTFYERSPKHFVVVVVVLLVAAFVKRIVQELLHSFVFSRDGPAKES